MRIRNKIAAVILFAVLIVGISGCTGTGPAQTNNTTSGYPMTVIDDYGRPITITSAPEKIISLTPVNTEILFALGLGDKVVGVTDYCNYPPEARNKTKVSDIVNVNAERVAMADPDVVFAGSLTKKEVAEQLESMGYKVIANDPRNASDVKDCIMLMGNVTGATENATRLVNDIDRRVTAVTDITSKMNESDKPKVLLVLSVEPSVYVAGSNCYGDDLITLAGGRNAGESVIDYGVMSTESIVDEDPDIIIVAVDEWSKPAYESLKNGSLPWMKSLSAVKNGKVYALDSDTISRAGPRLPDAVDMMARAIHPELFK